jgi:hypothetical protein
MQANKPLQLAIKDAVLHIQNSPTSGEVKTGDLQDVYVYNFRFNKQEYLIAYKFGQAEDWVSYSVVTSVLFTLALICIRLPSYPSCLMYKSLLPI